MIKINQNHSISNFVISSAFGTSGTGIPIYKIFYDYLFLLTLARQTKTTIIAKSLTPEKHIGNVLPFSLLNPFPFLLSARKYIKRIPEKCFEENSLEENIPRKGLVNSYRLTNEGVEIESNKIRLGAEKGFQIIPGLYGGCSKLELQKSLILLEKNLGPYFFALELEFCPNIPSDIKVVDICEKIELCKKLFPDKFLIIKLNYSWPPGVVRDFEKAGTDCFHAINSVSWPDIFPFSTPLLPVDCQGSVSGPAIFPKSVKFNKKLRQETNLPIIMGGGLWNMENVEQLSAIGANSFSGCTIITDNSLEARNIMQKYNA